MFLKSMDMFGFKSFADRTTLDFEPGITVIVGPNGCGKSNVVDAIKWVLGEKQAKNIRGERMEDIIFSGTDQRKQVSLSEVFITIDNSSRVLDFEADSVTVGRRIFRDGESEYLINKSTVRLKDVEKLFMDTGIGKVSYSVMEQGKMDLILSTSAEDRRYIFEEAAGISRYKFQKKESLKKLTETGDNLERINDIIKEIEREKDIKFRQAEKTKAYLALRKEFSERDIRLNFLRYRDLAKKQEKLNDDIEKLRRDREAISARVSATSAENEKDEKRKNDIQHQLFELEKRLQAYKIRVEDIDVKTDKNRKLIDEQKARIESIGGKIRERSAHRAKLSDEKDKTIQSGIDIGKKIDDDRKKLDSFFTSRKRKIESINRAHDQIEQDKRGIADEEKSLAGLREILEEVIRKLVDAIEKRKAELAGSEEERQKVRAAIHESLDRMASLVMEARRYASEGIPEQALATLDAIDVEALRKDISSFEGYEDGFRSILFDKTGIHAEKERLDSQIAGKLRNIESLRAEIARLEGVIRHDQQELEDINGMITRVEKDLSRNETERDWIQKHVRSLEGQIADLEKQIESYNEEIQRSEKAIEGFASEIKEWEERLMEFNSRSESLNVQITELIEKRTQIEGKIVSRKGAARKDEEELNTLADRISSLEKGQVEVIFKKNNIEEYLWVEYEKKVAALEGLRVDDSEAPALTQGLQEVKAKIHELGPINNLAIEEYRDLTKRFEYYLGQKKDIEKAREDILSVIEDINRTSVEMFLDTFKKIQKNFSDIFRQLFEGGDAAVEILDPENILESGIDIMVRPPGKKLKNINLLSGGERALTAIALLFATYMVKPSPFCFLDEIDAPLDEENIGRFLRMLRDFARGTQFVIVSHNKKTMSIGESIYGVTMEEPGISKIVSLRMEKIEGKAPLN